MYDPRVRPAALCFALLTLTAAPAHALAPCPDICHFAQGTPMLLADRLQIWVRRCATPAGGDRTCVAQRLDRYGNVLAEKRAPHLRDREFEKAELEGHKVVRFEHQSAWTDLGKPYVLEPTARAVKLEIAGDTLVCTPAGQRAMRRPLGCSPVSVHVYAAASPQMNAGVVMGTCKDGGGEREVVAVC